MIGAIGVKAGDRIQFASMCAVQTVLPPEPPDDGRGEIVWVQWDETRHRNPINDLSRTTVYPTPVDPIYIRARITERDEWGWIGARDGSTCRSFPYHSSAWFPLDAVEMLAHADGVCPFCLNTGQVIGRPVSPTNVVCMMCRELPAWVANTNWIELAGSELMNGTATSYKVTWTMPMVVATRQATYDHPADYRSRSRLHLLGRFRPKLDREERARRHHRRLSHSQRPPR